MTFDRPLLPLPGNLFAALPIRRHRRLFDGLALAAVIASVASIAVLVHLGMSDIRDGLPSEVLEQERDIGTLEASVARSRTMLSTGEKPTAERQGQLRAALGEVSDVLVHMRRSYSFDSVYGASAAHALIQPAVEDLSRWLDHGLQGHRGDSKVVHKVAARRLDTALLALRQLRVASSARAQQLLTEEAWRIESLRRDLIVAIAALGMLAIAFVVAIMRQRDAETRATRAQRRLADAMDSVDVGIALFDRDDRLALRNEKFGELYPGGEDDLQMRSHFVRFAEALNAIRTPADEDGQWLADPLVPRQTCGPILVPLVDDRWVQVHARPTHEGGTVLVTGEVTLWRRAERALRHMATHDSLTGLPSRHHFETRLTQALAAAERHGQPIALMFIDVDYFKSVNDSHGHAAGDQVLVMLAERLRGSAREGDLVARISGDEFAVLLDHATDDDALAAAARRILQHVSEPMDAAPGSLRQTVSIGIARFPKDADDASALMRCADEACYAAKRSGRDAWRLYQA